MLITMTGQPTYETKDVYSAMASFETKNVPGYVPVQVPEQDLSGTANPNYGQSSEEAPSQSEEASSSSSRRSSSKSSDSK